jgi:hypothetical protein
MELKDEDLIPCEDFNFFESRLTALRKADDSIAIELNKINVNSQDDCGNIWRKLTAGYELRDRAIHRCLDAAAGSVAALRAEAKANPDDTDVELDLLREQDKLSNIKSELTVEQIVKNRSLMLFKNKCHSFKEARSYRAAAREVQKDVVGPSVRK